MSHITQHPWKDIDVAIFVLEDVADDKKALPIPLWRELPPVGTEVTAMGWGWSQHNIKLPSNILQSLNLPIAETSDCNKPPDELNIKEHEFCCGERREVYTNICHGDSGSPLVYSGNHGNSSGDAGLVQIGIAARGRQGCLREFNYAAFIRLDHKDVYTWIVCVILFIGKYLVDFHLDTIKLAFGMSRSCLFKIKLI